MLPIVTFFQQAAPGAAGGAPPAGGGLLEMLLLPLGMIVIFYFLLIRPQNQRMKKHKTMLEALKKGDTVLTQGGIIGKIFKISEREVTLDTGEGGKLRVARGMVVDLYNAGEPAPANDTKES
ncbi:MAG TPA: preprotein translocase subunit YajC [Hyphomonadaceae bacterium]|nr:preprotein translocase subunit YajC [Hyphomonadaceae bacterium]